MKILIWKFKYGDTYFDISTTAKEDAAYRYMFDDLEEEFKVYCELTQANIDGENRWVLEAKALKAKQEAGDVTEFMRECAYSVLKKLPEREQYIESLNRQLEFYKKAKKGDMNGIRGLIQHRSRKGHEYETFRIIETTDPTKRKRVKQ
jgi:hypothetical protein